MEYLVYVNENNFSDILERTKQMPTVFYFMSPNNQSALEMEAQFRRFHDIHEQQFLLAIVNCDEQPMIAAQFRIQAVPCAYFFAEGQPVDAIVGALSDDELNIRLANILPKEEDLKFQQALSLLENEAYDEALPLLKAAWEMTDKKNSDFALLYAETYIAIKKVEPAKAILAQVPIQDRDSRWHGLQAQIQLLEQAADSPEIQQLQADYAAQKTPEVAIKWQGIGF